ncbi:MAG: hypothetical protein K2N56_02095 [Oscillospiraceae bacterium]|nr:hypothetical protein [Oscillospiraceae bacterium]
MAAVYNAAEGFLSTANADSLLRGAEAAERAAEAYYGLVSSAEQFSAIMESAALGGFFGANIDGGRGDNFLAHHEVTDKGGSAENISFDIAGGIAIVRQYYAEIEAVRAAVGALADNTNGVYEITISFGGVLGGMIAVTLAAVGNSVIWLRDLCAETMTVIGSSAAVLAADFGQMWDDPVSRAAARILWFGNSAFSVIGAVRENFGSVFGGNLFNNGFGTVGGSLVGGDPINLANGISGNITPIIEKLPYLTMYQPKKGAYPFVPGSLPPEWNDIFIAGSVTGGAAAGNYIPYDEAFAAGYAIGDFLMRFAGGYSNTRISNTDINKISADVSGISENTGKAAAASEISGEDLKFLRDIAARDVINRFTTAEVNVSMGGVTNNLSGTADLDGIVDYLASGVKTALENAAEGVHS